ncbi:hypothetical protein WJX74_005138 [Apatococcus lobatus]|uniref:DNA-directed DNA polymerase family A palm domain-containing protein n=1 Tax=Apatococcus lobatus TaxID=904363 RepID=A0AAW1RJE9_9CHLO
MFRPTDTKPKAMIMQQQLRRQAVNTVPQGSAADLVKLVMIQLAQQLPESLPNNGCRVLLQVIHHQGIFCW